jgi:hypothetical protein
MIEHMIKHGYNSSNKIEEEEEEEDVLVTYW